MRSSKQPGFRKLLRDLSTQFLFLVIGFLMLGWLSDILRKFLNWATELHWTAGLISSTIVFFVLLLALWWIWNTPRTSLHFGKYPATGLLLNLLAVVLLAMVAMATVSKILHHNGWASYSSTEPITVGLLLDFYGWQFIDSIPIADLWKIFEVSPPAESDNALARFLVLLFRLMIVGSCVALYKTKRGRFQDQFAVALARRRTGDLKRARHDLNEALSIAERAENAMHQIDAHLELASLDFELKQQDKAKENVDAAQKLIESESKDRDLDLRRQKLNLLAKGNKDSSV